jgi:hypothetical protein
VELMRPSYAHAREAYRPRPAAVEHVVTPPRPDLPRQLAAAPATCHLCHLPAAPGVSAVLRPASGVPRPVGLCESCQAGRPRSDSPADIGPADIAWCVLTRDAEALLRDYESGQWLPYEAELRFAEDLARLPWTETSLRAAQQTAPPYGRVPLLLDNACFVLRYTDSRDPALLPLRRLVDVLADDAEQEPTAPGRVTLLSRRPPPVEGEDALRR